MFYLLVCYKKLTDTDYGQDFLFYHKTKGKEKDKPFEQHFLKEFKAT